MCASGTVFVTCIYWLYVRVGKLVMCMSCGIFCAMLLCNFQGETSRVSSKHRPQSLQKKPPATGTFSPVT